MCQILQRRHTRGVTRTRSRDSWMAGWGPLRQAKSARSCHYEPQWRCAPAEPRAEGRDPTSRLMGFQCGNRSGTPRCSEVCRILSSCLLVSVVNICRIPSHHIPSYPFTSNHHLPRPRCFGPVIHHFLSPLAGRPVNTSRTDAVDGAIPNGAHTRFRRKVPGTYREQPVARTGGGRIARRRTMGNKGDSEGADTRKSPA